MRKRLGRSDLRDRIIIGAINISLYLKTGKIIGWQPHLDLLIEGMTVLDCKRQLRRRFRRNPTAPRPYVFAEVTDPESDARPSIYNKSFRRSWYADKAEAMYSETAADWR